MEKCCLNCRVAYKVVFMSTHVLLLSTIVVHSGPTMNVWDSDDEFLYLDTEALKNMAAQQRFCLCYFSVQSLQNDQTRMEQNVYYTHPPRSVSHDMQDSGCSQVEPLYLSKRADQDNIESEFINWMCCRDKLHQ